MTAHLEEQLLVLFPNDLCSRKVQFRLDRTAYRREQAEAMFTVQRDLISSLPENHKHKHFRVILTM
jgi:hypothetical protein